MIPVLFINCRKCPFISWIISGEKVFETRTRNTLKRFIGQVVYLAETGNGKPVVKCLATITGVEIVRTRTQFERFRKLTMIEPKTEYDWTDGTTVKYLYRLENIYPVPDFVPPEDVRHGRTWMEYNPRTRFELVEPARQWVADCYHCSEIWGQKMTEYEMYIDLFETERQKDPGDYSPDPSLFPECLAYWNALCDAYPN